MDCGSSRRSSNFSKQEVEELIRLVKIHKDLLESKKSDAVTWREKEEGWQKLCLEFNESNITKEPRTSKVLKAKWENVKKNSKKKFAAEKEEIYRTGGGKGNFPKITTQDDDIKEIIGIAVTGLQNCFDSDYIDEPLEPVLEDSNIELIFDDAEEETVTFENNQNDIFQRSESSKATRKFKRPLPRYVEQDQTDVACKIQIDQSPKNNTANAQETWAEWTPTKLKKPLSTELTGRAEQKQMKKTKLTEDCRQKIKSVSEARLDFLKLQTISLKDDQIRAAEEHALKMLQMKELHLYEIEKKKKELEILKMKLVN